TGAENRDVQPVQMLAFLFWTLRIGYCEMEKPRKKVKSPPTPYGQRKGAFRIDPDGTHVYSAHASFADLYLEEARHKLSEQNRQNASQPKRKAWAEDIAQELIEQHPEATFDELWKKIPRGE